MDTSAGDVFAQLESAVAKWSAQLEETEARLHEAAASPASNSEVAESLQREVQDLRRTVESLLEALEAQRAGTDPELAALSIRCEALEAELKAVRAERDDLRAEREAAQPMKRRETSDGPSLAAFDSQGRRRRLGDILLEAKLVSEKQLSEALREQKWTRRRRLGDILIERGVANDVLVGVVLAGQLRLPFVSIEDVPIDEAVMRRIPAKTALRHTVIPLRIEEGRLVVATANPLDLIALDDVELACGMPVQPVVGSPTAIRARLGQYFGEEQ